MKTIEQNIIQLFRSWSGTEPQSIVKLPGSGSYRSYYRLASDHITVLGAHNDDVRENEAFISFTNHFRNEGLPVPEILANDIANRIYLISDLGDTTLYQLLTERKAAMNPGIHDVPQADAAVQFPPDVLEIYKKAIGFLPAFQVKAGKKLDYNVCYPRGAFDRQSMMWDLNYFKYYFLKLAKIPFDEQALEDDFKSLCDILLQTDDDFFLYRDFQSRNIMVVDGEPWFIDYQGGRRGALQYDVASLLTDGKADLPMTVRKELLDFYLTKLSELHPVDGEKFMKIYHGFALIRILQALGAYGFRGYYENKPHFLQSIPFALSNLRYMRLNRQIGFGLKTLMDVIDMMIDDSAMLKLNFVKHNDHIDYQSDKLKLIVDSENIEKGLTITIHSFSYKNSLPVDETGHGGGFIFDCRALPNPGRYEEFKQLNGKDQPVIDYLTKEPEVDCFLALVYSMIDQSVKTYLDRKFSHLMVSFGCTGGQHRSVYCAEKLADHLKNNHPLKINLIHLVQSHLNP